MRLDLIKGFETSLIIDNVDTSIKEDGFLAESYKKAQEALKDYVDQTDNIRTRLGRARNISTINNLLYRSPQNIIVFSGRRGTGKTSTMLSFAKFLTKKDSDIRAKILLDREVLILDPIDPTMLENNQNILNVVLSRLLFKAEEVWNHNMDCYNRFQDKEKEKNDILSIARKCLNGVNAIKSASSVHTLADLQKIGDSAILKKDLYEFVEKLNSFCIPPMTHNAEYPMLVILIDDTDCQISKGYQVMEDIRKYLTLPNVLILMATDINMLRLVFSQYYASEFNGNLKLNYINGEDIKHYAEKYMAKLLPPMHKIYLPVVDDIIREKVDTIEIGYYTDIEKKNNILLRGESFQSKILNFIYQKTHIVFCTHDAYLNNMIPTTLRGLTHLLNILSSMQDVPEIDFSRTNDKYELCSMLKKQFPILERNLDIFESYFMNDWIHAKLTHEQTGTLEKISTQVPDQRIAYAYNELSTYYNKKGDQDKAYGVAKIPTTYRELDRLLRQILGTAKNYSGAAYKVFRQPEDFYFIFAVRTLFTIKNCKDVLKIKQKTIDKMANKDDSNLHIIFDYKKDKTSLPTDFYMDITTYCGQTIVTAEDESYYHNFTDYILKCLSPEQHDLANLSQEEVYKIQEFAVLIASNYDVQETAFKSVAREVRRKTPNSNNSVSYTDAVERIIKIMQQTIASMNDNMLSDYSNIPSLDKVVRKMADSHFSSNYQIYTNGSKSPNNQMNSTMQAEIILSLLDEIPEYPTIHDTNREETINNTFLSLARKISDFDLDHYLPKKSSEKAKLLVNKLNEFRVTTGEDGSPNNKTDYDQLKQEIRRIFYPESSQT